MKINKFYIIATVLFSLLITSCNNEDTMLLQTNSTKHNFEINASLASLEEDDDNTRASLVSNMITQWAKGDGISVINLSTKKVLGGNLVAQTAGTKTTFTGTVTGSISAGDKLAFLYPAKNITTEKTLTSSDFVYNLFGNQTTTTPFVAKYTYTVPNNSKDITLSDAEFSFLSAYLKMNLSTLPGGKAVTKVTIENMGTSLSCMPNADGSDLTATGTLGDINIDLSATTKEQGYTVVKFSSAPIAKQSQDRTVSVTCGDNEYVSSMVSNEIKSNAYVNVNVSAFEELEYIPFADLNFKREMVRLYDKNGDGEISTLEANKVAEINLYLTQGIKSLNGIQYFKNLTALSCNVCQLTSLDVSNNTKLTRLDCYDNKLTSLDLSKNTALTRLEVGYNKLTSLDVSKNTALTYLDCYSNQLTNLDLSKNTALTELYCKDNQLTRLDVSKNTALTRLDVSNNQLTSLDVSNTALTKLWCYNNQLTSLDVSKNTALTSLEVSYNKLTSLDVSKNTALTELLCYNNQLTSLDVSKNTALTRLDVSNNQLTRLDVSKNTALTDLWCTNNQLTSLDVSNTALTYLGCYNNQLTSLDVSMNTALTNLWCYNNQLTSLDVSNTALTYLGCYNNQLTSLDVSKNTALTELDCHNNQLTSLDVSKNTALTDLWCTNNPLTTIYIYKGQTFVYLSKPEDTILQIKK